MKYDKTTIIGLSTCVLLFLLWPRLLLTLGLAPPPQPPEVTAEQAPPTPPAAPAQSGGTGPATGTATEGAPPVETQPGATAQPGAPPAIPFAQGLDALRQPWAKPGDIPTRLTASKLYTAEIDPDGGGVVAVSLEAYARDMVRDESQREAVVLGRWDYPFLALDLRQTGFTFGPAEVRVAETDRFVVQRQTDTGLSLTETWSIRPETPYQIHYSAHFRNEGTDAVVLRNVALEAGAIPPSIAGRVVKARGMGAGGISIAFSDTPRPKLFSAKKIAKQQPQETRILSARPAKWIAVHSQYFVLAVAAGSMVDGTLFAGSQMDLQTLPGDAASGEPSSAEWFNARGLVAVTNVPAGEDVALEFTGIAGPKKEQLLAAVGGRLESVVGMDTFLFWHPQWMGFLTGRLLRLLVWLNDLFGISGGYGLAIIVITVAVKVIFWPLTHHSTKSMRKMQQLQPQLKELRERYKDEPQKLYRKQSEFLKEHKVSQLGGCLPMVLQLPVFFALFITFRSAIELRHASFLWATDLSMPDDIFGLPIRPLAILMGLTMLLQQKLTPSSGDPQQQRMMMFMSAFFIFLFYSMPSGLTLYWTVNQLLSIVQTLVTRHLETRSTTAPA